MLKGIYLTVLLRFDSPDLSSADRATLTSGLKTMLGSRLREGTPGSALTGEIKGMKWESDSVGQVFRSIIRLTGEQEPAQSFTALATTELKTLVEDLLQIGTFPLHIELIEENTNALEELDSDEAYHID
jgi:hypothetical protein